MRLPYCSDTCLLIRHLFPGGEGVWGEGEKTEIRPATIDAPDCLKTTFDPPKTSRKTAFRARERTYHRAGSRASKDRQLDAGIAGRTSAVCGCGPGRETEAKGCVRAAGAGGAKGPGAVGPARRHAGPWQVAAPCRYGFLMSKQISSSMVFT